MYSKSSFEKIDISKRETNPLYHDRSRDIETALAWNAVKKTLLEAGRDDLFEHIQSVKVTEKYITVRSGKPIINSELRLIFGGELKGKKLRFL